MKDRSILFTYCLKSEPLSFYPWYENHEAVEKECLQRIEKIQVVNLKL